MVEMNWKVFSIKNPNTSEAFETLCYFLFCRKFGLNYGIRTDFNQVGLETEPIKYIDGKYYGFQSKFFEKSINYDNIKASIDKALENYPKLNHIIIFLNQPAKTSSPNPTAITNKCSRRDVTVEWFLPENFKIVLNQPNNLDLAEFYFGKTDILRLLTDNKSMRMNTLLQSKEYIDLNLINKNKVINVSEYCDEILKFDDKLHLLSGAAGSGKSVCMRKLFNVYGGFEKHSKKEQLEVIQTIGAICIFINLNSTSLSELENIVLEYKNNYFASSQYNNFIYLFDGLDEVPSNSITSTLLFIEKLLEKDTTKKIIISSRISSYNKFILKTTFPKISEYTIDKLDEKQVKLYFEYKGDVERTAKLNELCNNNAKFYDGITDILTLSLLWEHIFKIKNSNYFIDLMEYSVSTILNKIHHIKYLDKLNLPNPKQDAIIKINKELAFYLFENDKFSFTQKELQEIINITYPKCDYNATNQIISYIAEVFFDTTVTKNTLTFSYRHRRYLEYFTILSLEKKIQEDLSYLRKKHIIINHDLFENMLLPYLQNKAIQNNDIPLAFQVGLFNVYLGNDRAWGVYKFFYYWSDWIVYSIAVLPDKILQNLIEDTALPIRSFFNDVPEMIFTTLSTKNSDYFYKNEEFRQFYMHFIHLITLLHKFDKQDLLPNLLTEYEKIEKISREKNYFFNSLSNRDNYLVWRSILYIKMVVYNKDMDYIVDRAFNNSTELNINGLFDDFIDINIFYLSSLYYNLIIYYPEKCVNIIKMMTLNQLSIFALALTNPECIGIIKNHDIANVIIEITSSEITREDLSGIICLALKKNIGCDLSENETRIASNYLNNNQFKSYSIFWKQHCDAVGFILMAFGTLIKEIDSTIKQYSNAYNAFFKLLNGTYKITKFISCIHKYLYGQSEAVYYIKILLGKGLALYEGDDDLKGAIDYLNDFMKDGGILIVYHTMKLYNFNKFMKVASISNINRLNTPTIYKDIDYSSTSDLLFMLSFINSSHNKSSCYDLLLKGLSYGMMRMNERKDTIADYNLLESLEIILKKNWLSTEELITYLKRILLIANNMNLNHISNNVHGIIMELLLSYDFNAAEYYYTQIAHLQETYNYIHYIYARNLVKRGKNIKDIVDCLKNITTSFDNYHQKLSWDTFYYKLRVYLDIAICDFYPTTIQNHYFDMACKKIDELEHAGWNRELKSEEYEIYSMLCAKRNKKVDVEKEQEREYHKKNNKENNSNILDALDKVKTESDLKAFISKMQHDFILDKYQLNEQLIQKSVEITGNIDDIISLLSKTHYPSNTSYSVNSKKFWLLIVAALNNPVTKNSINEYLLTHGGGHDGFNELIKIYAYLGNKDICIKSFDTMLDCIEFLLG